MHATYGSKGLGEDVGVVKVEKGGVQDCHLGRNDERFWRNLPATCFDYRFLDGIPLTARQTCHTDNYTRSPSLCLDSLVSHCGRTPSTEPQDFLSAVLRTPVIAT